MYGVLLYNTQYMEEFYHTHDVDTKETEACIAEQEVFQDIMDKFEQGELTYNGKGGTPTKVTNPKQAYAIAIKMSERKRREILQRFDAH